ncbi:MAG: hypothetical protein HOC23_09990 [Halieaceae bacterium]|jgi:2-oxoglutarate/2-oxoacid ferredoxin oxidoreductase subunit beta|nr:hypothetical protein [Halieaceae bacterium]
MSSGSDILQTDAPPSQPAEKLCAFKPDLLLSEDHHLCPGCGEPIAVRMMLEAIKELECSRRAVGVIGIGCYTALTGIIDTDLVQALHGRAPSVATGTKRMLPNGLVYTLQGDGDMVNEGLQEVIHSAARGENITCILLNNGVFGETGGHMTASTVVGQRTKNTIDGRDAKEHGQPILISEMLAQLSGTAYVARCGVFNASQTVHTKRILRKAFQTQLDGKGFSFVEILTMCPTGWFVPVPEGPDYLENVLGSVHKLGELKCE